MSRHRKHRNLKLFIYSALVVGGVLFFAYQRNQLSSQSVDSSQLPQQAASVTEPWTQVDFAGRRKLSINSSTGAIAEYLFDHAEMVDALESRPDGADLRIVAQQGSDAHVISTAIAGIDGARASIKFDTSDYPTATYFLYFGNRQQSLVLGASTSLGTQPATAVTATDTELPSISLQPAKYWVLRYKSGTQLQANIRLDGSVWSAGDKLLYGVVGSAELKPIAIADVWTNPLNIDLGQIATGEQGIYLITQHNGVSYRSPNAYVMISEPMFVAWTIDWEGRNVTDNVLTSINKIANTYQMPLTQFFNPRIYIDTSLPEYRRAQLTNWIKARLLVNGDELSLHLHMYYDVAKAAGVTPRKDPHWGTGTDGYDVPASSYTSDEMGRMLRWAVNQLESNTLPKPKGFRAGGWFANTETLKAINDNGFVYDSSGREDYKFGGAELAGTWNLKHSQQPYHPSASDQNSSTPEPVLRLWEVPNNGNDSYWFSAEDMIARFYQNYTPGRSLDDQKLVTYLSHPDWFDVDQPKLIKLFLEIDKFSNSRDQGPVVFTTLSNALQEWQ